ncbi:MAG: hypothetical protein LAT79_16925 [Kiritimatiellae bacterium]|nr:hypothetical protein [Kiritimatiellia bacterium]
MNRIQRVEGRGQRIEGMEEVRGEKFEFEFEFEFEFGIGILIVIDRLDAWRQSGGMNH